MGLCADAGGAADARVKAMATCCDARYPSRFCLCYLRDLSQEVHTETWTLIFDLKLKNPLLSHPVDRCGSVFENKN